MKKLLIILLLCCSTKTGYTQIEWIDNRDSLVQLIKAAKEDTGKVWKLYNLAILYVYNTPDSGLRYGNDMLALSQKLDFKAGIGFAFGVLSSAYTVLGQYSMAIQNSFESIRVFSALGDSMAIAHINHVLGEIYYQMGDYKKALAYEYEARKKIEALPGTFHIQSFPQLKKESIMYSDAGLSAYFLLGNMTDSALYFAKRVFEADRELNLYWSYTPLILGDAYAAVNEPDSALKYYHSLIKVHAQNDEIDIKKGIAAVFQKKGQLDSCIYYAKMALDSAEAIRYTKAIMNTSELLSQVYEKINPAEAIRYYKKAIGARDSLYNREKLSEMHSVIFGEERRARDLREAQTTYRSQLRFYTLAGLACILLLAGLLLYRNNRHRKKAYLSLQKQKEQTDVQKAKLESTLNELKATQEQLVQSEKMASLGELTAGIAHEIQNPLNFVNNFSELNNELIEEVKSLQRESFGQKSKIKNEGLDDLLDDIFLNNEKINYHGKRADSIVKSMLQHTRQSSGKKEPTNINALADEYFRLAYHGMRARDKEFSATTKASYDDSIGNIDIVRQDIGRVLLNLLSNACYAVREQTKLNAASGNYEPLVAMSTRKKGNTIEISISDNGTGIPEKVKEKIFQPFFTTKPTGQGTGLGLSLSYDIVKAHGGELKAETKENEGSIFTIVLPYPNN